MPIGLTTIQAPMVETCRVVRRGPGDSIGRGPERSVTPRQPGRSPLLPQKDERPTIGSRLDSGDERRGTAGTQGAATSFVGISSKLNAEPSQLTSGLVELNMPSGLSLNSQACRS